MKVPHALAVIEGNAWAQKQIIEDILDVSGVITGKLQCLWGPVDLVAIVDAALDAVTPGAQAKEIKIETTIDAGLRIISGDADRLQQVVGTSSPMPQSSLLRGEIDVRVSRDDSYVQIQVCDTGPESTPSSCRMCSRRFAKPTDRPRGPMVAWASVWQSSILVELHGGVITAENRTDGSGAIFSVKLRLPSGELRKETLASALNAFAEPESEPVRLDGLRILIVDDENDTLDLVTMELTQQALIRRRPLTPLKRSSCSAKLILTCSSATSPCPTSMAMV